MAGGAGARGVVRDGIGGMAEPARLDGRGLAQGKLLQPPEEGGEQGQQHGLQRIPACARSFAVRLRAVAQGSEGVGQIVPMR